MSKNPITQFSGQYQFLSNFYDCVIQYKGMEYPSVEHAFQASKASDATERFWVKQSETPGIAKRRGRKIKSLRPDWEDVKFQLMEDLIRIKFITHPDLKQKLIDTEDAELIEGNTWGDSVWGIPLGGYGHNHLGKILMKVRDELKI